MYSITDNYERDLFTDIFSIVKKSLKIDLSALKEKSEQDKANVAGLLGAGTNLEVKAFGSSG